MSINDLRFILSNLSYIWKNIKSYFDTSIHAPQTKSKHIVLNYDAIKLKK